MKGGSCFSRNRAIRGAARLIVIDPTVCGGRAVIDQTRIAVEVVAERFKAGDSFQDLASDYGCAPEAIQEAIRCELPIAA